jgi:plasmid maintenance system antidote protein VapI
MNLNLKAELIRRFGSQVEAAKALGFRENRISRIVRGHSPPTPRERQALEEALGKTLVERLFEGE